VPKITQSADELSLESTTNQILIGEHLLGYGEIHDPQEIISRSKHVTPKIE